MVVKPPITGTAYPLPQSRPEHGANVIAAEVRRGTIFHISGIRCVANTGDTLTSDDVAVLKARGYTFIPDPGPAAEAERSRAVAQGRERQAYERSWGWTSGT